jgi:hypothetical protein
MFGDSFFNGMPANEAVAKRREVVGLLRPKLYRDGVWTVDYRRLRVLALKTA